MSELRFEWNENKNRINKKKHGVSFEEAKTVFLDENARLIQDPEHSIDEDRFVILGISSLLRTLVVCHCYRENDDVISIFSARKANSEEEWQYTHRRG